MVAHIHPSLSPKISDLFSYPDLRTLCMMPFERCHSLHVIPAGNFLRKEGPVEEVTGLVNKSNKNVVGRGKAQIAQTLAVLLLLKDAGNNTVSEKQE